MKQVRGRIFPGLRSDHRKGNGRRNKGYAKGAIDRLHCRGEKHAERTAVLGMRFALVLILMMITLVVTIMVEIHRVTRLVMIMLKMQHAHHRQRKHRRGEEPGQESIAPELHPALVIRGNTGVKRNPGQDPGKAFAWVPDLRIMKVKTPIYLENRMKNPPANTPDLVELGFMDARSKLLDIAAWLDRIERYEQEDDYRVKALYASLEVLNERGGERARKILDGLSDPSVEPIPEAHTQGAAGAYDGGDA